MLTAQEIYSKTMTFNWMKLMLGGATLLLSLILFAICAFFVWIFNGFENGFVFLIAFSIWLSGTKAINFLLMQYFGYFVKAGHVAIIAKAVTEGVVPDDQFNVAKNLVTERFGTSNIYFLVDKLVDKAVHDIGRTFDNVTGFIGLDRIPGFEQIQKLVKFFLHIALGYVDECCLGWTFCKMDQSPFKSAADGVVIYFQNWKILLKGAAKTALIVIGASICLTIASLMFFGLVFKIIGLGGMGTLFVIGFALMTAWIFKVAFIDSWILVSMMTTYMQVAPTTELKVDIYEQLCRLSAKFKELFQKGQAEAAPSEPAPAAASDDSSALPPFEGGVQ